MSERPLGAQISHMLKARGVDVIFGIPGLGRYFVQGALNRDYTLVMGVVVFYGMLIIVFMRSDASSSLAKPAFDASAAPTAASATAEKFITPHRPNQPASVLGAMKNVSSPTPM